MQPTLSYQIARADRIISKQLTEILKAEGISLPQYATLFLLKQKNNLSNSQLAEKTFVKPQSANKIIQELDDMGYIERHADLIDKRKMLINLTDSGNKKLLSCNNKVYNFEDKLLKNLDINLINLIKSSLDVIVKEAQN